MKLFSKLGSSIAVSIVGLATPAWADCLTTPAPGEAILYAYSRGSGQCIHVTADTGRIADLSTRAYIESPTGGRAGPVRRSSWDNRISAVWLGQGTRLSLYADKNFDGNMADYIGSPWDGDRYYDVVNAKDASSLVVSYDSFSPIASVYVGEYPTQSGRGWSWKAQGMAHDASTIYLTRTDQIFAVPRDLDLATIGEYYYHSSKGDFPTLEECFGSGGSVSTCTLVNHLPAGVRVYEIADLAQTLRRGYNHFGDPDFWNGFLFVPVENVSNDYPLVAVFDSDLHLVAWDYLDAAKPDPGGVLHAPFLTVRSDGVLMTSGSRLDANNGLQKYWIDPAEVPTNGAFLHFFDEQVLLRFDPKIADGSPTGPFVPIDLTIPQGGDLSDWDEDLIYVSNGCCNDRSGLPWGVRAFHLSSGAEQAESASGYGLFNYKMEFYEEPEGIDFLQTDDGNPWPPGFPHSQLHVMLIVDLLQRTRLKHYSF
jgi:hypothetical protein